jgi:hypothetical protein
VLYLLVWGFLGRTHYNIGGVFRIICASGGRLLEGLAVWCGEVIISNKDMEEYRI